MQCIILYIYLPDKDGFSYDQSMHWSSITDALNKLCKQNGDAFELGKSCWLIPLSTGLPELAVAIYHADKAGFSYKTLNIDKKEDWINYPMVK